MLELPRSTTVLPRRFAFGGVAFEIESDGPLALSARFAPHAVAMRHAHIETGEAPLVAHLRCDIHRDPSLPTEDVTAISITRESDVALVTAIAMRAALRRRPLLQDGFTAEARIANAQPADAVVLGLAAAVIEWQGGLHLHAAALELDGRAVLFVGPSGAGKSTAVTLATGGSVLSCDRVSVFARGGEYWVWSQPGGTPNGSPRTRRRALPLAAILRVRHGRGRPRLERLRGVRGAFVLRESVDVGCGSHAAEERRMLAVLELAAAVPIGEIHSVLGVCHAALVREFTAEVGLALARESIQGLPSAEQPAPREMDAHARL